MGNTPGFNEEQRSRAQRLDAGLGPYAASIGYLQRNALDDQGLRVLPQEIDQSRRNARPLDSPLPVWLARLRGVARPSEQPRSGERSVPYVTRDILAGLGGQSIPLYFLVRGQRDSVRLYLGTEDVEGQGQAVRAVFASHYPGLVLWPAHDFPQPGLDQKEAENAQREWAEFRQELQAIRSFLCQSRHLGIVTGIPSPSPFEHNGASQIDRLVRGLYGEEWALLVLAMPEEDKALVDQQVSVLREQVRVEQEEGPEREVRDTARRTAASYYLQLLEMRRQFLEGCLFEGGWWVQSYLCAPELATYQRGKALLKSVLCGDFSRLERIRVLDCPGAGQVAACFSSIDVERPAAVSSDLAPARTNQLKYHTLVSSGQLSSLIHLPQQEMPGYYVSEAASFDVSSHVPADEDVVKVGEILDRGRPTGNSYRVRVDDLNQHCLLVGITGSGKTNTSFSLLMQLQQQDPPVPFLVIEPAKREYRALSKRLPAGRKLRVFTAGEEGEHSTPFRLNPFEIRPGVNVQTHMDLLKSVFNASFAMWAPLPQVLERAIHELYRDKGWDAVSSTNNRIARSGKRCDSWPRGCQPTLTDLFEKVSRLVPTLGYDKEVTGNIKTALETRINSLRIGAKGLMLDTPLSIPVGSLLEEPTVLELEGLGDDDEKAFLIGLILTSLYEHYRALPEDKRNKQGRKLSHLTVIEEAHRLLKNVPMRSDPETSNLGGKAVETFVNMLSEVRAYGEGFLIAEQIPTKLAPDVIKNTALKVMHRMVANDDREVMGGAMNLDRLQLRHVVSLGTGEAVVHGGGPFGDDSPMLVKVPRSKDDGLPDPRQEDVRAVWEQFRDQHGLAQVFMSYPTCAEHCNPVNLRCADARRIVEHPAVEEAFATLVVSLVAGSCQKSKNELPALLWTLYDKLAQAMRADISQATEDKAERRCALTHLLARHLERRGAQYGWEYSKVDDLAANLLPVLLGTAESGAISSENANKLAAFCRDFVSACERRFEPFFGCRDACGATPLKCLYRFDIEPLIRNEVVESELKEIKSEGVDLPQFREQLASVCEDAAKRVLGSELSDRILHPAALCFLIQKTHSDRVWWPVTSSRFLIEQLAAHYAGQPAGSPSTR